MPFDSSLLTTVTGKGVQQMPWLRSTRRKGWKFVRLRFPGNSLSCTQWKYFYYGSMAGAFWKRIGHLQLATQSQPGPIMEQLTTQSQPGPIMEKLLTRNAAGVSIRTCTSCSISLDNETFAQSKLCLARTKQNTQPSGSLIKSEPTLQKTYKCCLKLVVLIYLI